MFKTIDSKLSPFGGLHLIHEQVISKKYFDFIDTHLGSRVKTVGYNYSNLLMTRIYTCLCGGSATEDVNYIRENTLNQLKNFKVPSADTILRSDLELSTPCEYLETKSGGVQKININDKMNRLLIGSATLFGILPSDQDLIYDFDHQFIATEKYDATKSYKMLKGYFPGVASIEGIPLYIEGRNGNCSVKSAQLQTHQRAITALRQEKVYPKYARMDAGSYIKEVTDYFDAEKILFFIRANQSQQLLEAASEIENWNTVTIGIEDVQVSSLAYQFGNAAHRIVVQRQQKKSNQVNAFTGDNYSYRCIITNDWEISEKQAIEFYNARGASEKLFDIQNNDFNWKCMPHSFLEQNTVYLIIMAIAHVIYKWLITLFSEHVEGIEPKSRLKKFIFRFVNMVAKVTKSGRQHIVSLNTEHRNLINWLNSS